MTDSMWDFIDKYMHQLASLIMLIPFGFCVRDGEWILAGFYGVLSIWLLFLYLRGRGQPDEQP